MFEAIRQRMTFATASCWFTALAMASVLTGLPANAQLVDQGPSIEACIGCHSSDGAVPVGDIASPHDAHFIDLDPRGPAAASGYRQLNVAIDSVDIAGATVILEFRVADANGAAVDNVFDSDGRFVLAHLVDGVDPEVSNTAGEPKSWTRIASERFTTEGGVFEFLGTGSYRYTSLFDPTSVPVAAGDTLRAAIQLSASDIPAGNGWCDFDADLGGANDCVSPTALTRDIVETATCNGCHGTTSDTKLAFHGGGRTEVEYCVTCHNPGLGEADFKILVHKIHYGSSLTQEFRGDRFSHVTFTRDIDDCTNCHKGNGVDVDSWKETPTMEACGSCHDHVDFAAGVNHNQQTSNRFCHNCHPSSGEWTSFQLPVPTVHQGEARAAKAGRYRDGGNGFSIDAMAYDRESETVAIDFSVTRDGEKVILQTDEEFQTSGGSLNLKVGWSTEDYTNDGSDSAPAPAQPPSFSLLDIPDTVTDLGEGNYQTVVDVSSYGFGTLTAFMDGHPVTQVVTDGPFVNFAVRSAFAHVSIEARQPTRPRRQVIDINKCNACHDGSGAGLSLHGNNRVSEMQVCVVCHNANATDIRQRPADPAETPDGKREESIDMKRMIHRIHMGEELEEGIVVYGFGNQVHDYSEVEFIGNIRNCLTCHVPGSYGADDAWVATPTTIDSGPDPTDPTDDLNLSPVTSVCSSCHDSEMAMEHMILNGGTFASLDVHIAVGEVPVPEPGQFPLVLAAMVTLVAIARRRSQQQNHSSGRFRKCDQR